MSVSLYKRSDSVDGAKEEPSRKNATVVAKFYFSQVTGLFFLNVSKRSLTAEARKGNVPPSVSIYAWASFI